MMYTISVPKVSSDLGYTLSMPSRSLTANLPLLVYLHGAGERGTDLSHLTRHAIPRLISKGWNFPAVVLCPQCPANCVWDNIIDQVKALIDKIAAEKSRTPDQFGSARPTICKGNPPVRPKRYLKKCWTN